jgi:hypothetical protein
MNSTRQWMRQASLVVGTKGQGIEIGTLRITFKVEKTIRPTPNQASILVYNLSPDQEAKVKNEYTDVMLQVGYQGATRMVFGGNIKRAFTYKEETDWITEIQGADGDKDYTRATLNKTLAAGYTDADIVKAAIDAYGQTGGTAAGTVTTSTVAHSRGRVLTGPVTQLMHRVAENALGHWSIQDGKLYLVKADSVLPDDAIVVNETTGMIGAPEISDKGIIVKCQLNPQIRINGALKLDNNDIKVKSYQLYVNGPKVKAKNLVRLSPDGIYKVYKLTHEGDTWGEDWFTTSECVAVGSAIPAQGKGKKTGPQL